jgi:hypothetical protein
VISFVYCQATFGALLAILIHHAMNAPLPHGLTVVNMLRREATILAKNQFYAQKCHRDSNY